MTSTLWFDLRLSSELHTELCHLSDRKLHLLTVAILRRVWDDLPSDHTRIAVAATAKFADGYMTADELARLRSTDLLDSAEPLWTDPVPGSFDEELIGLGCACGYCCDQYAPRAAEYECRVARNGYILEGVRAGVDRPEWMVVKAARFARDLAAWKAEPEVRDAVDRAEAEEQCRLFREIAGPGWTNPRWPEWLTNDVLALARGIYCDRAYDRLPILADALQDAGCIDEIVLKHCREGTDHVRGCWVVDLAMGIE